MILRWLASLLILTAWFPTVGRAAELFEWDRSSRAMGMGGVYLPFVTSADAVLWNPAVLGGVKEIAWEVVNVGLGVNGKDALEFADIINSETCEGVSCYRDLYGKPLWVGFHGATKLAVPRVGLAVFTAGHASGLLHNPAFPNLNLTYLNDYGFAAGYGFPLFFQNLHVGVAFKRIHRWGGSKEISLSTVTSGNTDILDQFDQRGVGYGMDMGVQWSLPGIPRTVVAMHWQDIGFTSFLPLPDKEAPPPVRDNLSLGIGTEIDLPGLDLRAGIEYRHITHLEEQLGKKIHVGAEVGLAMFDFRAGLNQGYPTLGVGMDFLFFRLDAASYSEEMGVYPGQTPSHRYKVDLTMSVAFDADFKFLGSDGKRRRLKQRR